MEENQQDAKEIIPVNKMYENWFLDYASYVILERAVPSIFDGLKPVQRRILHSMYVIEDGRYNKVANIVGQTMQYHPHGDVSIGDAIVNMGQKEYLIDSQGNWGDSRTGDGAAAFRYIEARLSKFALHVLFNNKITEWKKSYDGRKDEPVYLPVKFPLLLLQGAEGIAVGLSTKILPHNFCELVQSSIDYLKGKKINLLPDFPSGGMIDCTNYNEGLRGSKVRVRAKITTIDKKKLLISELPYGCTTTGLIDSILKAHQKGKIKIKNIVDNTANEVSILINLASGQKISKVIDALYVFTDCETSISPNSCVILDDKPSFLSVNTLLEYSTDRTKDFLKKELELEKASLNEKFLFLSLEKIFISNRIYHKIENCENWESVIDTIDKSIEPYKDKFYRKIVREDIIKLTEIKIKRISKYDIDKTKEELKLIKSLLKKVNYNLKNIVEYSINYFQNVLEKFGEGRERKSVISTFNNILANDVVVSNQKLYVDRKNGFIGYGIKKEEFVCDCSDIDDIIVFRKDGKFIVTKVTDKIFVGKDIINISIFNKQDQNRVYNIIYLDGNDGISRAKRFRVNSSSRNKEYDLTKGSKNSRILYFSDNRNSETEIVSVLLSQSSKAKQKKFEFNFDQIEIKNKSGQGKVVTRHTVKKIMLSKK